MLLLHNYFSFDSFNLGLSSCSKCSLPEYARRTRIQSWSECKWNEMKWNAEYQKLYCTTISCLHFALGFHPTDSLLIRCNRIQKLVRIDFILFFAIIIFGTHKYSLQTMTMICDSRYSSALDANAQMTLPIGCGSETDDKRKIAVTMTMNFTVATTTLLLLPPPAATLAELHSALCKVDAAAIAAATTKPADVHLNSTCILFLCIVIESLLDNRRQGLWQRLAMPQ